MILLCLMSVFGLVPMNQEVRNPTEGKPRYILAQLQEGRS